MADAQLDIDRIVREVLRRLQEQLPGAGAAGPEKQAPDGANPHGSVPPATAAPAPCPPTDRRTLAVGERVVTLATLAGRLDGVQRVRVSPGSLVTPAVRDELRKRQIELVRGAASAPATVPTDVPFVVGVAAVSQDAGALVSNVCGELGADRCVPSGGLIDVVQALARAVVDQRQRAVLLTSQPVAAVCLANRRRGVRAAWGCHAAAVSQAVQTLGANLLVLDPAAHGVHELRRMVQQFVHGGPPECPAELRAALETPEASWLVRW